VFKKILNTLIKKIYISYHIISYHIISYHIISCTKINSKSSKDLKIRPQNSEALRRKYEGNKLCDIDLGNYQKPKSWEDGSEHKVLMAQA
jgi:hypothetical protein